MSHLPDAAKLAIPSGIARELFAATEELPDYENCDFYDHSLQQQVYEHIYRSCPGGFEWLRTELQKRLRRAPYCALIKGLRFDENHCLLVAINRIFGTLVARPFDPATPRARLIHHIQPATDKNAGTGEYKLSERLHTDGAERPVPFRYLSMQCVRPDAGGGGSSLLLDIDTLRETVIEKGSSALLSCLQTQAVPWKIGDYLGGDIVWAPVLQAERLRWRRYTIDDALLDTGISLPEEMTAALDMLDEITTCSDRVMEFFLDAHDCVIIDNWRCLHARTPVSSAGTARLMLRAWVET